MITYTTAGIHICATHPCSSALLRTVHLGMQVIAELSLIRKSTMLHLRHKAAYMKLVMYMTLGQARQQSTV